MVDGYENKGTIPGAYYGIIGLILIIAGLGLWSQYKARFAWKDVVDKGVITVAKVLRYESGEYGSDLSLEVYVGDKKFTTTVDQDCDECVGRYYFVKILKEDPLRYPLIYTDDPVPDCILSKVKYFDGWKDIPECDSAVGKGK